ncbi:MAG: fused signal recognition particle receptor [Clostridia bacterium]|nr:fused signal recognition particle receptor [Clostridia bacterium]
MGFFSKLKEGLAKTKESLSQNIFKEGLAKTRENFSQKISQLFKKTIKIDEDFYEELEEILLTADVGAKTSLEISERLREEVKARKLSDMSEVREVLEEIVVEILGEEVPEINTAITPPTVILVVGINGAGKTTTIGKIANRLVEDGNKVILAAADTFRAAAAEQLSIWAERSGAGLIQHQAGSDPAAVVFDAIQSARSRGADYILVDTAGRLQTKTNLMEELKKIGRVIRRELPGAPHEVLLVLDATIGQNAISQAKIFNEAVDVTGIVLTKLDGTAKGGVVLAITNEMGIPVKLVGLGEGIDDLKDFEPRDFVEALFRDLEVEKEED